jgi:hypothetical protein
MIASPISRGGSQADEEDLPSYEVSDEALEAAAGNEAMPTATFICSGFCCQS